MTGDYSILRECVEFNHDREEKKEETEKRNCMCGSLIKASSLFFGSASGMFSFSII